jgi:hypothetical protein
MPTQSSQFTNGGSKQEKDIDYTSRDGFYLRHYPATLIVLLAWIGYIVLLLFLLNDISQATSAEKILGIREERLVEFMFVIFTQAHGPVTAAILARLAISSLQSADTAPRTWAELFWLADRSWQGPVSISNTYLTMARRRIRPSTTFILFTAAYALTIVTPSIITKAWPSGTIFVPTPKVITINAFSTLFNSVDNVEQLATGEGTWTSGLSIIDIYNSSIYNASDASSGPVTQTEDDYFIGSDAYGMDVTSMSGIRLSGGCQPVSGSPVLTETDGVNMLQQSWCPQINATFSKAFQLTVNPTNSPNISLYMYWCSDFPTPEGYIEEQWTDDASKSLTTTIAFVNSTVGTNSMTGYLNCSASFLTGKSNIISSSQVFSGFQLTSYSDASNNNIMIPLHPLYGAFYSISQYFNVSQSSEESTQRAESILSMLGYQITKKIASEPHAVEIGEPEFTQIDLATFSRQMWTGATHMAAALVSLSRNSTSVNAVQNLPVAGRNRNGTFVIIALTTLGAWLLIVVYCIARMFRPTFGGSLNAYAAARLLADWPDLVDDHCCGDIAENDNLRAVFGRIEDTQPDEAVGHIGVNNTPGRVAGQLDERRAYRGQTRSGM